MLGIRRFTSARCARALQLFAMPSMSPTMTEGGIVAWKVQPGAAFRAGDELLEIETDKAEISVEAADDGILFKLLEQNGASGIPVGKPIAVVGEAGDSAVEVDAFLASALKSQPAPAASAAASSTPAKPQTISSQPAPPAKSEASEASQKKPTTTTVLPAAQRLLHESGLKASDIQGSGPNGRITKGDVLAHLGRIPAEYPQQEKERFSQRSRLDLSGVKPAAGGASAGASAEAPKVSPPIVITKQINLNAGSVTKLEGIKRAALRRALLSLQPKPSVLRDATLDILTAPTSPPFKILRSQVIVKRGRAESLFVSIEHAHDSARGAAAAQAYLSALTELCG